MKNLLKKKIYHTYKIS